MNTAMFLNVQSAQPKMRQMAYELTTFTSAELVYCGNGFHVHYFQGVAVPGDRHFNVNTVDFTATRTGIRAILRY